VRLPKVIEARSADDQEIFKRLVWGMDPGYIAQDLNLPEDQCWEIETLLKNHAKRVYERVMANRTARQPKLSIDALLDDDQGEDRPLLTPIDAAPDPEQMLVLKEEGQDEQTRSMVFDGILDEAAKVLSTVECLILIFLYNEEYTAAQIVQAAASNEKLGLAEVVDVNRVYYIKDRALGKVLELVVARLNRLSETGRVPPKGRQRALLKPLEEFIKEQGFPVRQA